MSASAITKPILKLARQLDASRAPEWIVVEPGEECVAGQSWENVTRMVRWRGGSLQRGWSLRELPTVYVEGTCHAVWKGPDGKLIDVTPRTDGETRTLFLQDSKIRWSGEDVEPRRMLLHMQACYCGTGLPFKICCGQSDE